MIVPTANSIPLRGLVDITVDALTMLEEYLWPVE